MTPPPLPPALWSSTRATPNIWPPVGETDDLWRDHCLTCGDNIDAFITDPCVVHRILSPVGLPTEAPAISPARAPPQLDLGFDADWAD